LAIPCILSSELADNIFSKVSSESKVVQAQLKVYSQGSNMAAPMTTKQILNL